MRNSALYRHRLWHEGLLSSFLVQFTLGLLAVVILPTLWIWGPGFYAEPTVLQINSLFIITVAFGAIHITLWRLLRFPGENVSGYILPTIFIISGIAMALVLLLRLPYSNTALVTCFTLSILWFSAGHFLVRNLRSIVLAIIPSGQAENLATHKTVNLVKLQTPRLPDFHIDGVVADLRSDDITPEWEQFIADCTLQGIPVYHAKQVSESLTGRIRIDHLSENEFGALLPSFAYQALKRLIDIVVVLVLAPLAIPAILVCGYLIRRESPGSIIYVQPRVGYRGKIFNLYKIRTMKPANNGTAVTQKNDSRISPTAAFIRKYRLDELPQLWNVLKGEMSLIGPRPESRELQIKYEELVPFFRYRHVVRPGISGWAQVMQGYTEHVSEIPVKLEFDFYYIKHFSLWLDMLIVFKTIKTVLTGFGSR